MISTKPDSTITRYFESWLIKFKTIGTESEVDQYFDMEGVSQDMLFIGFVDRKSLSRLQVAHSCKT